MKRLLTGLVLTSMAFSVVAAKNTPDNGKSLIRPTLTLDSISPIKPSEQGGDEIYLAILEYHSNGSSKYYTVPQSPVYWPSGALNQVKNLQLWQGKLKNGEAQEVVISVVEQDVPPWNMDDLIGVTKIKIRNDNGKMVYEWYKDGTVIANSTTTHTADFKAEGGEYKAVYTLKLAPDTKPVADKSKK